MSKRDPNPTSSPEASASLTPGRMLPQEFQALDLAFMGSLLPGIIHNLATPLSGVLGATQLLEKRAATIEELVGQLEALSEAERSELLKQFDRNRTNVDILSRNAKHLADLLQVLVQRLNRGSCSSAEYFSLNDLLQNELRFLDSNLTFKHKVKKQVALASDLPPVKYVYGHIAAALDEFAISSISMHDFSKNIMSMDFGAASDHSAVTLSATAHLICLPQQMDMTGPLEFYMERLRDEGWSAECTLSESVRHFKLSCACPLTRT